MSVDFETGQVVPVRPQRGEGIGKILALIFLLFVLPVALGAATAVGVLTYRFVLSLFTS